MGELLLEIIGEFLGEAFLQIVGHLLIALARAAMEWIWQILALLT